MTQVVEGQRTFSVEEYHRMGEAGVFASGERVELIWGVIREISPKGRRHVQAVTMASHTLIPRLSGKAIVLVQDPVSFSGSRSEPEPDIVVCDSADPRSAGSGDTKPLLVIEVADSSLRFDREDKARLYAISGVPEYWIVNLVENVLEVFRDPEPDGYRNCSVLHPSETVHPLSFPELEIEVTDLIP
jgi:Uma2 family endonuclease